MKRICLFICLLTWCLLLKATTISGYKTIGLNGDYLNLTTAFNAISSNGIGGAVILSLLSNYNSMNETFPLVPPIIATSTYTITVQPSDSNITISSSNTGPTFNLSGVNFFILDGRINGVGNCIGLTVSNTSVDQGCCLKFSNDASNNIIKYCHFQGVNTSVSSGGVIIFSTSNAITGNDNNLIEYCNIGDGVSCPANAILSTGSIGKDNSGNSIVNCNIYNFFSAGAQSAGIYFPASSYNSNWLIENNSFYQTNSRTINGNFFAISSEGTATSTLIIRNNFIGGQSPQCMGNSMELNGNVAFRGLRITVSSTSLAIISGNLIKNISISTSSQSQAASGISLVSGSFLCEYNIINTITYNSLANGGCFSGIIAGTGNPVNIEVKNNSIRGISLTGNSNCSLRGISIAAITQTGSTATSINLHHNEIGSANASLSSSLNSSVYGIISQSACLNQQINFNTISFLQSTPSGTLNQVAAIYLPGDDGGNFQVGDNILNNCISMSSVCNITGILFDVISSGNSYLKNNNISTLSLSSSTGVIYGINILNTNNIGCLRVFNNCIYLGMDSAANSLSQQPAIIGINKNNGNVSILFNTIYVNGFYSGVIQSFTAAIRRVGYGIDSIYNNILVDKRFNTNSANGTKHFACLLANTNTIKVDANVYYCIENEGYIASIDNGITGIQSIQVLQQSFLLNNLQSVYFEPHFITTTVASQQINLHLIPEINCFINGRGLPITGIINDGDGTMRNTSHPDPGAYEYYPALTNPPLSGGNQSLCQTNSIPPLSVSGTGFIRWYSDSLCGTLVYVGNQYFTGNYLAGTYIYYVTDSLNACESTAVTVSLIIDSTAYAGNLGPDTSFCLGNAIADLQVCGYYGKIVGWQYSVFPFINWIDLSDTLDIYHFDSLLETTKFRVVVKNGMCNEVYSNPAIVIINLPPQADFNSNDTLTSFFGASPILPLSVSEGVPPYSFNWSPVPGLDSYTLKNPHVCLIDTILYSVTVTDSKHCKATSQIWVKPVLPNNQSGIKGQVFYANSTSTPLVGVTVLLKTISGTIYMNTTTNENGFYYFPAFPNGNYTLSATSNKPVGGINSTDANRIINSYVQMNLLEGLYLKAADVDASGCVNAIDALKVQRFYTGLLPGFQAGKWVFEQKSISMQGEIYTINLSGLCYGDVNASFNPSP